MSYVQKMYFRYTVPFNILENLAIVCYCIKKRALAASLRIRQVTGKMGLIKQINALSNETKFVKIGSAVLGLHLFI